MRRGDYTIFGLTPKWAALYVLLSLTGALFESFGMAMLLPLLEFIEKGQEVAVIAGTSKLWDMLLWTFDFLRLPVSLITLGFSVLLLMLLRVLVIYWRTIYSAWLSQHILHTTRMNLFKAYVSADYSFFSRYSTGQVVNLATTETLRVGTFFAALFTMISNAAVVLFFFITLMWLSPIMTIVILVFMSFISWGVMYFVRHTKQLSSKSTEANEHFSVALVERLSALRLIRTTGTEEREFNKTREHSLRLRDFFYWLAKLGARIDLLIEPFVVLAGITILILAVNVYGMSLSQVGLFLLILLRSLPLAKSVLRSRQLSMSNSASLANVRQAIRDARENREKPGGVRPFTGLQSGITLESVSFCYPGNSDPALDNVNMSIPAGRMTALIGPSGAGKSTLVDLLTGLRRPDSGIVRYDDKPASEYSLASLRKSIAFVSQDVFLFNDTVLANVAFAREGVTEEEVWEALRKTRSEEFVSQMPEGLYSVLGERGDRLSGGQKQRLSLARALIQEPSILILDEPTSALDSETESDIQKMIDSILDIGDTTVIAIAHRLATIRNADKIVILDQGRVIQEGNHKELVNSNAWYSAVSNMQMYDSSSDDIVKE